MEHEALQASTEDVKLVMGVQGPTHCFSTTVWHAVCVIPYKHFPVRFQPLLTKIFIMAMEYKYRMDNKKNYNSCVYVCLSVTPPKQIYTL